MARCLAGDLPFCRDEKRSRGNRKERRVGALEKGGAIVAEDLLNHLIDEEVLQ